MVEFPSIEQRLRTYCEENDLILDQRLGFGKDGSVWTTSRMTAVKVHERAATYVRERDVYIRLAEAEVEQVAGHAVPRLLVADDATAVLEMEIVRPPFALDFRHRPARYSFDFPPGHHGRWARRATGALRPAMAGRRRGVRGLERLGISMLGVHPGNIRSSND